MRGHSVSRQTEFSGVTVEPVAWLDDLEFAEAKTTAGGFKVFVSNQVSLDDTANRSRLQRLIGNLRGESLVGDECLELAF